MLPLNQWRQFDFIKSMSCIIQHAISWNCISSDSPRSHFLISFSAIGELQWDFLWLYNLISRLWLLIRYSLPSSNLRFVIRNFKVIGIHHYFRHCCQEHSKSICELSMLMCLPSRLHISVHTGLEQQHYRPRNQRLSHFAPLPTLWMEYLALCFAHFH